MKWNMLRPSPLGLRVTVSIGGNGAVTPRLIDEIRSLHASSNPSPQPEPDAPYRCEILRRNRCQRVMAGPTNPSWCQ